jgi:hypothetical protein
MEKSWGYSDQRVFMHIKFLTEAFLLIKRNKRMRKHTGVAGEMRVDAKISDRQGNTMSMI